MTGEVGNPIRVQQCDKPTLEEVRRVQTQYIDELMRCVRPFLAQPSDMGLIRGAGYGIRTKTSLRERGGGN